MNISAVNYSNGSMSEEVCSEMARLSLNESDTCAVGPSPFLDPWSLKTQSANRIAREVFNFVHDEEWASMLGRNSSSELHVHLMRHIVLKFCSEGPRYEEEALSRFVSCFLVGRFECYSLNQPERADLLISRDIEELIKRAPGEQIACNVNHEYWDHFLVELCRTLPKSFIPIVAKILDRNTDIRKRIFKDLLESAAKDGDAGRLKIFLQHTSFRVHGSVIGDVKPEHKDRAIECVRVLLSNENGDSYSIGCALRYDASSEDHVETRLEIRQILLDDKRTTSSMITDAFLNCSLKCQEVFEKQLINHPKANLKKLFKKATRVIWHNEPLLSPLWKSLLKHPRLPKDALDAALYDVVRDGNNKSLSFLLANSDISLTSLFWATAQIPSALKSMDSYRVVRETLDWEILTRCTSRVFIGFCLAGVLMIRCK